MFKRKLPQAFEKTEKSPWPLRIAVVASLVIAVASAYALRQYSVNNQEITQVLVAGRDIMPYTVITQDYLGWRKAPKGAQEPGTVQNPKEVVGKMTGTVIFAGEQIRKEKLSDPGLSLQPTERAIAIPSNSVKSVGGTIMPGDIVDLYWISNPELPAVLISQGARVMEIKGKSTGQALTQVTQKAGNMVQQAVSASVDDANKNETFIAIVIVNQDNASTVARAAISGDVVFSKVNRGAMVQTTAVQPTQAAANETVAPQEQTVGPEERPKTKAGAVEKKPGGQDRQPEEARETENAQSNKPQ
ncbi:hypothetical protein DCCM_3065 [Desulfocucumis palustris]|uniref:SAF domain-containing protein n=1 Tax=Desulfocucumis palustris TaxID=1898651 RepID=A0A2L2XD72_9FIRM|nr:Flp pilus assembly protein CpaB [Desulfocucumis palustris]GBF33954.1 hypothetical protein DCCM_3065 [Desulfocucumis palustris]